MSNRRCNPSVGVDTFRHRIAAGVGVRNSSESKIAALGDVGPLLAGPNAVVSWAMSNRYLTDNAWAVKGKSQGKGIEDLRSAASRFLPGV